MPLKNNLLPFSEQETDTNSEDKEEAFAGPAESTSFSSRTLYSNKV